jgi:hypothetical protein
VAANRAPLLDRLVGVCLCVLVGAAAIYIAVHLIEAVALALTVLGAIALVIGIAVAVLRYRRDGW